MLKSPNDIRILASILTWLGWLAAILSAVSTASAAFTNSNDKGGAP